MNQPRIEVADLVVRYGDVTAVDGIGFDIAPGELVTLLGPSGCGKTTTLRAVAGLETPSGGIIRLNGETVYSRQRAPQRAGREARRVDGVPVLRDLAAHDGVRQRRLRSARAQAAAGRGAAERGTRAGPGADAGLCRPAGIEAVGRPAAARRGGARDRVLAERRAVRRAAVQPRCQAARRDARGAARAAAPARHHLALCHARPGGGAGDLRPGDRDERRPDRADRHAGGHLQSSAQPLRRRLRRIGQSHRGQGARPVGRERHADLRCRRRRATGGRRVDMRRASGTSVALRIVLYPSRRPCRDRTTPCLAASIAACSTATSSSTWWTGRPDS